MLLYHFTHPVHASSIMRDEQIRTTFPMIDLNAERDAAHPRVVWLTDDPDPGVDRQNGLYDAKRIVRFDVDVPAIRWLDWAYGVLHQDPEWRATMIQAGGGMEFAAHWYVLPRPIRRSEILDIHSTDSEQFSAAETARMGDELVARANPEEQDTIRDVLLRTQDEE